MSKINSRAKGKSGEREVIRELKLWLPTLEFERNLEQTRNGGHDILGLPGWALEVKRYARVTQSDLKGFWQQTIDQARKDGARPALAYREDRQDWRAVVRASDVSPEWGESDDWELTCEMGLEMFARLIRRMDVQLA
jgi:hypothetical protein